MSNGGAQFQHLYLGSSFAGFYIDFYAAGTTTPKDVWIDESKNTAVQTITADSNGMAYWYADGDYDLVVKDNSGVTLWTFPNVKITSDTATMWEGNFGTSYPAATTANRWQLFSKVTGGNIFQELGINDGTAFRKLIELDSNSNFIFDNLRTATIPWIDVTHPDYGAKGDGTDDYAAIQAAIDTAENFAGKVIIYFPVISGNATAEYAIFDELICKRSNISFVGGGYHTVISQKTTGKRALYVDGISSRLTNIGMQNMSFVGQPNAPTVEFYLTSLVKILNCDFASPTGLPSNEGLFMNDSRNTNIHGCVFGSNNKVGLRFKLPMDVSVTGSYMTENLVASGGAGIGLVIDSQAPTSLYGQNITIVGNVIGSNEGQGVSAEQKVILSGNVFRNNKKQGAYLGQYSDYSVVNGNQFIDNNYTGTAGVGSDDGLQLDNTTHCSVTGNTFVNEYTDGKQDYGITEIGATSYNVITGNTFKGMVSGSILPSGGTTIVENNTSDESKSIASASSISLPGVGERFDVTGTTNIDTIAGGWKDRKVILYFSDVLTVNDGTGNLKLSGNLTTAADTILQLFYDGTNWQEISRSAN